MHLWSFESLFPFRFSPCPASILKELGSMQKKSKNENRKQQKQQNYLHVTVYNCFLLNLQEQLTSPTPLLCLKATRADTPCLRVVGQTFVRSHSPSHDILVWLADMQSEILVSIVIVIIRKYNPRVCLFYIVD